MVRNTLARPGSLRSAASRRGLLCSSEAERQLRKIMSWYRRVSAVLFTAIAISGAMVALSGSASADTLFWAMEKAYVTNPTLNAARAGQRATDELVPQALSGWRPTIGIGAGIAIPHGKLEEDTLRAVGVFIQLEQPIAFDAIDNQPVDLLFALLVPADQCKTHLHTLSLVAKKLADKAVCRRLRGAQSDEELFQIMTESE